MHLPSHLMAIPEDTALVGDWEDWCRAYVDTGRCVREWQTLHRLARVILANQNPAGTSHGFAGAGIWEDLAG